MNESKKIRWILGTVIVFASVVWTSWYIWVQLHRPRLSDATKTLRVVFLDVGYGDAAWITTPNGSQMLVDAGPGRSGSLSQFGLRLVFSTHNVVSSLGDYLGRQGVRRLDAVFISHPHYDHWGGLSDLVKEGKIEVAKVFEYVETSTDSAYGDFRKQLANKGIPRVGLKLGDKVSLSDLAVSLDVLGPREPYEGTTSDAENRSLILRFAYRDFSVLFTGDAGAQTEMDAMEAGDRLSSTVLKVASHGHRRSTTTPFLDNVNPSIAIISVESPNPFGTPQDEVIQQFIDRNIDYYRTDLNGTVTVLSDGKGWSVDAER